MWDDLSPWWKEKKRDRLEKRFGKLVQGVRERHDKLVKKGCAFEKKSIKNLAPANISSIMATSAKLLMLISKVISIFFDRKCYCVTKMAVISPQRLR